MPQNYERTIPDAPLPISMLPRAEQLTLHDLFLLTQPNNPQGQRTKALTLQLLKNFISSDNSITYHDVGSGSLSPINVEDDVATVVCFKFGSVDSSIDNISFSITGVKQNSHINTILLQGGVGMDTRTCMVTIDTDNTLNLPTGNSAIVFIDRYNNNLILNTIYLPSSSAEAFFSKVTSKSQSQGGGSEASMDANGFFFTDSIVPNAYFKVVIEDDKLKIKVGTTTNYSEICYDIIDGSSITVNSGSGGGGSASKITPEQVISKKISILGGNSIQNDSNGDMYAAASNNNPTHFTASYFRATQGSGIIVTTSDVDLSSDTYSGIKQGAFIVIANKSSDPIIVSNSYVVSVTIQSGYSKLFVKTTEGFFPCA